MAKKYYSKVVTKVKKDGSAYGTIEGRIIPKTNCSVRDGEYGKYAQFAISVQNATKKLKYVADAVGATLETYTNKEGSQSDTLTVRINLKQDFLVENFEKAKLAPGDVIVVTGDLTANTYNGKTSLQVTDAELFEIVRRANGEKPLTTDVDAVEKTYSKPTKEETVVEQPSFNTLDDEDTPF